MLLYLTIAFLFVYNTNAHGIIMNFTLNTILGDERTTGDWSDCATLLARSCFFVSRGNHKRLSLGRSFRNSAQETMGTQQGEKETCVVSFQKKSSKKRSNRLFSFMDHRDSLIVGKEHLKDIEDDDDETASTVDMDEDEFQIEAASSSTRRSSGKRRSVTFEEDLVTAVYTRPRTTQDDKYYLHYDEYDYMDFKLEYRDHLLKQRRKEKDSSSSQLPCYRSSPRKVSFKREVVESVHPVMDRRQRKELKKDLFYTEDEMRTFLDEFVVSLQKQQQQQQQQVAVTS